MTGSHAGHRFVRTQLVAPSHLCLWPCVHAQRTQVGDALGTVIEGGQTVEGTMVAGGTPVGEYETVIKAIGSTLPLLLLVLCRSTALRVTGV
jgi:hypothetical protein